MRVILSELDHQVGTITRWVKGELNRQVRVIPGGEGEGNTKSPGGEGEGNTKSPGGEGEGNTKSPGGEGEAGEAGGEG